MRNVAEYAAPSTCHCREPHPQSPLRDMQPFHVFHKVPAGDSPYVKAKRAQLVERNPDRAISLFRAAIEVGDRLDSALKDMVIVLKQLNRSEEAIQAIASFRDRCPEHAQESLDNVLLDLYKSSGRLDDQIALIIRKLNLFHQGIAFNGRRTKTARSQGKKFQVSLEQEATRLLGNLGWVYMQKFDYVAAEAVYRKALSIEIDNNKVCNLGICLIKQGRLEEAQAVLRNVSAVVSDRKGNSDSHMKSFERARELLRELETCLSSNRNRTGYVPGGHKSGALSQEFEAWPCWKLWQSPSTAQCDSSNDMHQFCKLTEERLKDQLLQQLSSGWVSPSSMERNQIEERRLRAENISGVVVAAAVAAAAAGAERDRDDVAVKLPCGQEGEDGIIFPRDTMTSGRSAPTSSSLSGMQQGGWIGLTNRRRLRVFQDLTILGSA